MFLDEGVESFTDHGVHTLLSSCQTVFEGSSTQIRQLVIVDIKCPSHVGPGGGCLRRSGLHRLLSPHMELGIDPAHYLARHVTGDWGDLDEHDKRVNDTAVQQGERILSAYGTGANKLWIITEWDRSGTTILRPDEY
jgi:hypothetical protein